MSFSLLPLWGWIAGLVGLAGALFVLQLLRVRHRTVVVPTTLFWQEVVEETRARVLVRRFRHPLAYLFILLIAALLWTAFADPQFDTDGGREHIVLLDGSARMASSATEGATKTTAFDLAVERTRDLIDALPRERTRVVLVASTTRTVLAPGESSLLFDLRMEGLEPTRSPTEIPRIVRVLAQAQAEAERTVHIVSAHRDEDVFDEEDGDFDPENLELVAQLVPRDAGGSGILELGWEHARSGRYGFVDVLAIVAGEVVTPELILDEEAWPLAPEADGNHFTWRDLPAQGGLVEVKVKPETRVNPLDDSAELRLPLERTVRVYLPDSEHEAIAAIASVLENDPGLERTLSWEDADVQVTVTEAGTQGVEPPASGTQPFLTIAAEPGFSWLTPMLTAELEAVGVSRQLWVANHKPGPSASACVAFSPSLFAADAGARNDRALPLGIAVALRWLAQVGSVEPRGETSLDLDPHTSITALNDPTLIASPATLPSKGTSSLERPQIMTASLLLVLALLMVEWWIFRAGRMP